MTLAAQEVVDAIRAAGEFATGQRRKLERRDVSVLLNEIHVLRKQVAIAMLCHDDCAESGQLFEVKT